MPIKNYGVLRGKASQRILATKNSEHFQILLNEGSHPMRIAINTQSSDAPSQVLFFAVDDFHHGLTDALVAANLPEGFTALVSEPGTLALDFIRSNLFDVTQMVPLPPNIPGDNNDLNDKLDFFVQQAITDEDAVVYAFGQSWLDAGGADQYFPIINPSTGIHDIHMNQGNPPGAFFGDNGVYQDGGLLFQFPSRQRWAAVFTAFQSESFHTDDKTGNPLNDLPVGDPGQPENNTPVRIIAALVNPKGGDVGKEYVLLLNKGDQPVDVTGWQVADKLKHKQVIPAAVLQTGDMLRVNLTGASTQLSNNGGIITLLNKDGLKIDGVSYTKADAAKQGVLVEL